MRFANTGRQPLAALNRGRHLYSAGRPSRWALAHISSSTLLLVRKKCYLLTDNITYFRHHCARVGKYSRIVRNMASITTVVLHFLIVRAF